MRRALLVALALLATTLPGAAPVTAAAAAHSCPAGLAAWRQLTGAAWLDCHRLADPTTTGHPYTDPGSLTAMAFPPPGSGTLNSHYTQPTTPDVAGLQIAAYSPHRWTSFQA